MRKYHGELIHQARSEAGLIQVVEDGQTRCLHFGDSTRQSAMSLVDPAALVLSYTRDMMACLLFKPEPRYVLLVGLGGGSLAKFLLRHYPGCRVDAVEPRADVVRIAREHFALPQDRRLRVYLDDGIGFAREASPALCGYDLVLVDAYDPGGMVSSVADDLFLTGLRERMARDGVLAVNLSRPQRVLYRQALRGLRQSFPRGVFRLPVVEKGNEVVLGFTRPYRAASLRALKGRTSVLQDRLGIDFPDLLRRLQRHNGSVLAGLLGR